MTSLKPKGTKSTKNLTVDKIATGNKKVDRIKMIDELEKVPVKKDGITTYIPIKNKKGLLRVIKRGHTGRLADGRTTIADLAYENPGYVVTLWNDYQKKSGKIKSRSFVGYVRKRQLGEKGAYGEVTEAFKLGQNYVMVKAPKDVNLPGIDMIIYDKLDNRIWLIDNKALKSVGIVSEVSALQRNLPQNIKDDITLIKSFEDYPDLPKDIKSEVVSRLQVASNSLDELVKEHLDKLKVEKPDLNERDDEFKRLLQSESIQVKFNDILEKNKINRIVTTSGGGSKISISTSLKEQNFILK